MRFYIMTSKATDAATREFFQQHACFGLQASQIVFFQQVCTPLHSNCCLIASAATSTSPLTLLLPLA